MTEEPQQHRPVLSKVHWWVTLICFLVSVAVVVYVPTQVPLATTIEGGMRHFRGGAPLLVLLISPFVLWQLWNDARKSVSMGQPWSRRDLLVGILFGFPFILVLGAGQVYLGVEFLRAGGALG